MRNLTPPSTTTRAGCISLSVLGDGFVEAVPDATFLALAKQNHGEAIMVPVLETPSTTEVGRFGWKNPHASLLGFAGDACLNEMSITNELFPDEVTTVFEPAGVAHPNDVDHDLGSLGTFMRAAKVPPRGPINAEVNHGQAIFQAIGCASCHVGTLVTALAGIAIHGGAHVVPDALGGRQFHPLEIFCCTISVLVMASNKTAPRILLTRSALRPYWDCAPRCCTMDPQQLSRTLFKGTVIKPPTKRKDTAT